MARRNQKRKAPRKFTGVNVLALAEAYALTSIWTEAAFKTNPIEFITGMTSGGYNPGTDGSHIVTLPELLGAGPGGIGGNFAGAKGKYDNLQNTVSTNVGGFEGLIMAGAKTVGVSIGFKLAKKLTARPRSMLNRQVLKPLGMSSMVRV